MKDHIGEYKAVCVWAKEEMILFIRETLRGEVLKDCKADIYIYTF
jgi:hypothetical protein